MAGKKFISFAAAFVAAAQALTFVTATGVAEEAIPDANTGYISAEISEGLPDNNELLKMYIEKIFYGDGVSLYADYGASHLEGGALAIYNFIKSKIEKIASGESVRTEFDYVPATPYTDSDAFYKDVDAAIDHLMVDMPAEFYWYDKTVGYLRGLSGEVVNGVTSWTKCTLTFEVSKDYVKVGGETVTKNVNGTNKTYSIETDNTKIAAAKAAVANAKAIADECAGLTDYEKIVKFNKEICALTDYNYSAADNDNTPYGNPWQLVWVFDGDPSTNVVCEGYAKAFQYLCDLTGVECYTVTGVMRGGTGAGGHMWNVVVMDDEKSYLVDITNCDGEEGASSVSIGYPDKLLLKGASQSSAQGCSFSNLSGLTYTYDADIIYDADLLTVSTTNYEPPAVCEHVWSTDWERDENGHWHICTRCHQESAVIQHTEILDEDSAVPETCTTDGKKADTVCSDCGFKIKEGEVVAAHHTPGEAVRKNETAATCANEGSYTEVVKCTVCGEEISSEEKTIEKLPHTRVTVQENVVGATCTEPGSYDSVVRCSVCNEEFSRETVTNAKLPHTPGTPERKNETAATCAHEGSYTEVISCTVCGEEISSEEKTIEKLPHTPGTPERKDETAATCAHEGSYTEVISCTVCGEEISSVKKTIDKLPHNIDNDVWESDDNTHWHECSKCGIKTDSAEHKFDVRTTPATCTEDGEKVSTCVDCGKVKTEVLVKTGHKWDEGKVTKEPTCTDKGEKTFTCSNCGQTRTEDIDTVDHTWNDGEITTPATCTTEGEKTFTCTKCGTFKTEVIAKTAHTFDNTKWETDGDNHKNSCTVCGAEITEKHDFTDGETTTEPTCTDEGEITYTCVCGETKTETIDALGHEPGEAVRENEVAATVDKEGSYDSVIRCTRCNEIIKSDTVTIPKLTPADETPFIKGENGKSGWEVIGGEIKSAKDKDVITVDMNKATVVPKSVFEEVRGKDVTVSFELDNELVWSVNGKTVADGALADIDFSVKTGSDFIPESVAGTVKTDEKIFTQISLAHNGAFGFTAVLSVDCGKSNANLFASLYYYNGSKLDKISTEKINTDGIVKLPFAHASDYLITIHEEKTANEPANDQSTSKPDNSNSSDNPSTGINQDSLIWIAALSCLVLTAPVFKRRKSGK